MIKDPVVNDSQYLLEEKANVHVIDSLYQHQFLDQQAKNYALNYLYPNKHWGYWVALIIKMIGYAFIVSGLVLVFSHHWDRMSTYRQVSSVTVTLICCLYGAWLYLPPFFRSLREKRAAFENKANIQFLLDWLTSKGLLREKDKAQAYILCQANESHLPMSVQILFGLLALAALTAILGLLHFFGLLSFENPITDIILGVVLIIAALGHYYSFRYCGCLVQNLSEQVAFVFMLAGKISVAIGLLHYFPAGWSLSIIIALLVIPIYFIFPHPLDRFIGILALWASLFWWALIALPTLVVFYGLFVVAIASCGFLLFWPHKRALWEPLTYACLAGVLYASMLIGYPPSPFPIPLVYFDVTLGVALAALCVALAGDLKKIFDLNVLFACIGLILLSLISSSAILCSIGFLMIGAAKHVKSLVIIGAILLGLSLIEFYDFLPITLNTRAQLLVGSGIVLLFIDWVIERLKWDQA